MDMDLPFDQLTDYLRVDDYIYDFLAAQALATALESGLIETLQKTGPATMESLAVESETEYSGIRILFNVLHTSGVVEIEGNTVWLHKDFLEALRYRELLEVKLEMARIVNTDILDHFSDYIYDMDEFMARARIFDLFNYQRCYTISDENLAATAKWLRYTSLLTRYEAPACLNRFDFSCINQMLDIGGNSGEFAAKVCEANPSIQVTVLDLPVVCELGRQYISNHPHCRRIHFLAADALHDTIPTGFDLVTFKSVLHDWPEEAVETLISRARESLVEGGKVLIFERAYPEEYGQLLGYGNLPLFLFVRYYRDPHIYVHILKSQGFEDIVVNIVQLDIPFMLVSARRAKNN